MVKSSQQIKVQLTSLGCARNDVDSEELAGRLDAAGFQLVDAAADLVVINTCGFIEQAKKDSIDTIIAAADTGVPVVAVGCLAERYGTELAAELPEAAAVLGFDDYPDIAQKLQAVLAGEKLAAPVPQDRRNLLPITPVDRTKFSHEPPGHQTLTGLGGPKVMRKRISNRPVAPLKIASGCDRRCTFCAIPRFRGSFVSRPHDEILQEAQWLAEMGVKELVLVSENSTSYGKDLGDHRALEKLLKDLAKVSGIEWIRATYLQPAETRPTLVSTIAQTAGVVPYYDLSFQHASAPLLRKMKRFGGTEDFLALITQIRELAPTAGIRSNFIVGFPGESEDDFAELEVFLTEAKLDAIGIFGYSVEDGTEAAEFAQQHSASEIQARVSYLSSVADELVNQRAQDRIGERTEVIIEEIGDVIEARAVHQGPETDGNVDLIDAENLTVGGIYQVEIVAAEGVDLVARLA
ncbi:MAG: 30S ribosomal protein S12 methylthiotransferase RimO [Candidatus Nanopelagicales bacterium]